MPVPRQGPRQGPRRQGGLYGASSPLALPVVVTIPATAIAATSATLNGSVNPENLSGGTYWFVWGPTPAYGSSSSPTSVPQVPWPVTYSYSLTGLTQGATYHFSIVGQTPAGTVYGGDQTFVPVVPNPVVTPSDVLVPSDAPEVAVPHFVYPYTIVNNSTTSGALVAEQDSLQEVQYCVAAILSVPQGSIPELPDFGFVDPTFQNGPPSTNGLVSTVRSLEPRAEASTITQAVDQIGSQWQIQVNTTVIGTGD